MDSTGAKAMLERLRQNGLAGYRVCELLGHGKSAAVFLGQDQHDQKVALKVYDPELRGRFGAEVQEERLRREIALQSHSCPTLVRILGGGRVEVEGRTTNYLAMEFVEGQDLRSLVNPSCRPDDPRVRSILADLLTAADFLLAQGLCHRDIKVDNIRIRGRDQRAVLLDLGVLKPIGGPELTDTEQRPFIGTQRYAPPELLHRREKDDLAGWQAVTIYQIGTVLYELIQGQILFSHVPNEPYADVVTAVDRDDPQLVRSDVGQDLLDLARRCLIKDPERRLKHTPWSRLISVARSPAPNSLPKSPDFDMFRKQALERYAQEIEEPLRLQQARRLRTEQTQEKAEQIVGKVMQELGLGKPNENHSLDPTSGCPQIHFLFNANLEKRVPLAVLASIGLVVDENHVQLRGNFRYGDGVAFAFADRSSAAGNRARVGQYKALYDEVANAILDEAALLGAVSSWARKMFEQYFRETGADYEREMAFQKRVTASNGGVFVRSGSGTFELTLLHGRRSIPNI